MHVAARGRTRERGGGGAGRGAEGEGGQGGSRAATYVQAATELPLAAHLDVDSLVQREADEVNRVQRLRHGAGGRPRQGAPAHAVEGAGVEGGSGGGGSGQKRQRGRG